VTAFLATLGLLAASCTGGDEAERSAGPERGGIYRTALTDFYFTSGFDPTGDYGLGFLLAGQLLVRTLLTYRHVAGENGNELVPDLAAALPEVSPGGLTYTFHLKDGIRFGPPVDREITSRDIEYAFRRIDWAAIGAQYGFYYDGVIEGMDGPRPGLPDDITGIETPDDKTIIFHLQQPTGDFPYRLALPATAPIPEEVARCFTQAGDYGRDVISSGPYMLMGEEDLDISSCDTIEPIAGFDPSRRLVFVRNPNYDPATDSPEVRSTYLDGVSIDLNTNAEDIYDKIRKGELDGSLTSELPNKAIAEYMRDPGLRPLLHSDPADAVNYISMNMLVPPFDDLHVRRAVNLAIDKAGLLRAAGGSTRGDVATHVFPPTLVPDFPAGYDPYPSPGHGGDLEAARGEMRLSRYDRDGDGICDDPVCRDVLMITDPEPPYSDLTPIIQEGMAEVGIDVEPRELAAGAGYSAVGTVENLVPLYQVGQWFKDYPDPYTFAVLFHSGGISCSGQVNLAEVGMTEAVARECGVLDAFRRVGPPPSVDEDIAGCQALPVGASRTESWIEFDQHLMTDVVPWIPYQWQRTNTIVAPSVTRYVYDQSVNAISLPHIAVSNGLTVDDLPGS